MTIHHKTRRMVHQEWTFDKIIQASGMDISFPMSETLLRTVGMDVSADIKRLRARIKKYVEIPREIARVAAKREAMAVKADLQGHSITARDNYFAAALFYTGAQGTIHDDEYVENTTYSKRKNECYDRYIERAPHPIERVEIPFEDKHLPGLLHLPTRESGRFPCVVHFGGMDVVKEMLTPAYGDKFLERGSAVLCLDGPGQNEARITRRICCTADNFVTAGKSAMDFLLNRSEIDAGKIGIAGVSMGSFWVPQIVAHDHRYKAAAAFHVCHEPGMRTLFDHSFPAFKEKFMWMAGYEDESEFDEFAKQLTLDGLGQQIRCPILIVAGEDDQLSPIAYTYDFFDEIQAPKTLIVYKGEAHGISDNLDEKALIADWMMDRLNRVPMKSERILMDGAAGQAIPANPSD